MHQIDYPPLALGCDPEFFFTKNGKVIGSEKILPTKAVIYPGQENIGAYNDSKGKIIRDGIQAELNPRPNTCRALLGEEISAAFRTVKELISPDPSFGTSFKQLVKISQTEMDSVSESSKVFGCMPSYNVYDKQNIMPIRNAAKYFYRSGGGHIHLGAIDKPTAEALAKPETVIPIMDIIVGNTCVLIDRDKGNIERRKAYGRAGEYRIHPKRIEYRTLSNFWLTSYPLMSLVTGLARQAIAIVTSSTKERNFTKELMSLIDIQTVRQAINKNSLFLANRTFKKILPWLLEVSPDDEDLPLTSTTIKDFEYFIKKGIRHFFREDPLEHWINLEDHHDSGWESFLATEVNEERTHYARI